MYSNFVNIEFHPGQVSLAACLNASFEIRIIMDKNFSMNGS